MRAASISKWWILAAFWVLQGLCIYFITPAFIASARAVDPGVGRLYAITFAEYLDSLSHRTWIAWAAAAIPAITLAQGVFVWPVRRPAPKRARGWSLRASLVLAALAIAVLATALFAAASHAIYTTTHFDLGRTLGVRLPFEWLVLAWCLVSWGVATPLLFRFSRRGTREDVLSRIASRLFVGTIIETAAIIPLDVMVRRRESCYCLAGTYFALLACGAVGVFVLGPAILLPLLARRRKRWYEGRCEWCAYDMRATPNADRCPECGMGWKAEITTGPKGHSAT
jgi:hypothetical protein